MQDASLPTEVTQQLVKMETVPQKTLQVQAAVTGLEAALTPLLGKDVKELENQLEAVSRAELQLALAQATVSLFELLLKARGITTGMKKERSRLQVYKRRVRKIAAEKELGPGRQRLQLDVSAVNRFIAATQDLTAEQKAGLRAVSVKKEQELQQPGQGEEIKASESKLKRQKDGRNRVAEEKRAKKKRSSMDPASMDPALAFLDEMRSEVFKSTP